MATDERNDRFDNYPAHFQPWEVRELEGEAIRAPVKRRRENLAVWPEGDTKYPCASKIFPGYAGRVALEDEGI